MYEMTSDSFIIGKDVIDYNYSRSDLLEQLIKEDNKKSNKKSLKKHRAELEKVHSEYQREIKNIDWDLPKKERKEQQMRVEVRKYMKEFHHNNKAGV
jgi:hypothetical protein